MLEAQETTHFELLPTDDVGQRIVLLKVVQSQLRADVVPSRGTTLSDFVSSLETPPGPAVDMGYGSYVLTAPAQAGSGYLGFYFAAPGTITSSTDISAQTPWQEKEIWVNDIEWPDVLEYLLGITGRVAETIEAGRDSSTSGVTTTKANTRRNLQMLDQWRLIEGGYLPTRVLVRDYLTPFLITGLVVEKPRPSRIAYRYLGMQNVLRCLHEDVTVPPFLENLEIVSEFGTPNAAQVFTETGGRQFIPATNWTSWQDHIYRIEQPVDPVNGLYRTRVYFAYAPPQPPSALLAS